MANSTRRGPVNPPMGGCRIPARTPGPLGYMDQGDPNVTTLLGDTPGPLGFNDYADPNLSRLDPWNPLQVGGFVRDADGVALALGCDALVARPTARDPQLWVAWTPPAGYGTLYTMLQENEGNVSHMYLDTKNKVTVAIGTYLRNAADATKLRFYDRITQAPATETEIEADFNAVIAAKPDAKKFPGGIKAAGYREKTKLDMTPTDIGARWLVDVKQFQGYLPSEFAGFAGYPADAKQALTDIAYQYGAHGAAVNAASGKIKKHAEAGDWAAAAAACSDIKSASADRNAQRKRMFEAAAKVAPLKWPLVVSCGTQHS